MGDSGPTSKYFMGALMHECIYGNAPDYLKGSILIVSDVHNIFTRSLNSGDLYVKYLNNFFVQWSFSMEFLPGAMKVSSCQNVLRNNYKKKKKKKINTH